MKERVLFTTFSVAIMRVSREVRKDKNATYAYFILFARTNRVRNDARKTVVFAKLMVPLRPRQHAFSLTVHDKRGEI